MVARLSAVFLLILLFARSVPAIDPGPAPTPRPAAPARIDGVELEAIRGWRQVIRGFEAEHRMDRLRDRPARTPARHVRATNQ
jgi:hypothetical protein